jgi:NAD(P)H-dependent FMN reductase
MESKGRSVPPVGQGGTGQGGSMTKEQLDALMAQAGLKQLLIDKANRELDRLNQKKANYQKQLDNLLSLIEAAQTARKQREAVEVVAAKL